MARFKVDRLREASRILEPSGGPDPFETFRETPGADPGAPVASAGELEQLVEQARTGAEVHPLLLTRIFDAALELPVPEVAALVARTALLDEVHGSGSSVLCAQALVVADRVGRTDLIPGLLERIRTGLRAIHPHMVGGSLLPVIRALRRVGLRHELAELLAEHDHVAARHRHTRAIVAVGSRRSARSRERARC